MPDTVYVHTTHHMTGQICTPQLKYVGKGNMLPPCGCLLLR